MSNLAHRRTAGTVLVTACCVISWGCQDRVPNRLGSFTMRVSNDVRISLEHFPEVHTKHEPPIALPFNQGLEDPKSGGQTPNVQEPNPRPVPPPFTPESEIHQQVASLAREGQLTRTMVGFIPVKHRPWKNIMYWIRSHEPGKGGTLTVACGRWATKRWYGLIQYQPIQYEHGGQGWRETKRTYSHAAKNANPWLSDTEREERAKELGMNQDIWPSACRWMPSSFSLNNDTNDFRQRVKRLVRPAATFAKRGPIDARIADALRFSWAPTDKAEQETLEMMPLDSLSWAFESYGNNPIVPVYAQGVCKEQLYFAPKGEPPVECVNFSAQRGYEWSTLRYIDPVDYPALADGGG